jgi:hypothetical protein
MPAIAKELPPLSQLSFNGPVDHAVQVMPHIPTLHNIFALFNSVPKYACQNSAERMSAEIGLFMIGS